MRLVIQRVKEAKVFVEEEEISRIGKGILVFLGIGKEDTEDKVLKLAKKISELRIFEDVQNKMNLSIKDIEGEILVVSQFTLYANCFIGRRPSFDSCASPDFAEKVYKFFIEELKKLDLTVKEGIFGARMKVELINDGPVTFILEV